MDLDRAVSQAVKGLRETEKVLERVGNRLGLRWQPKNPNHIQKMIGMIAGHLPIVRQCTF